MAVVVYFLLRQWVVEEKRRHRIFPAAEGGWEVEPRTFCSKQQEHSLSNMHIRRTSIYEYIRVCAD
jgi:hypothetical protein